jgi:hypothetical protein
MRVGKNGSEDPNGAFWEGGSGTSTYSKREQRARDDRAVAEPRGILFGR